jgi:anthranilate 1,2-dioxygenase small subunit
MTVQLSDIEQFNYACAQMLNAEKFSKWPAFFAPQCTYEVLSRENVEQGLPAPLMSCYSHGMVEDRVAMLLKGTLTYRRMYLKHFITNTQIVAQDDAGTHARANVMVMQSTREGVSSIYVVGSYEDIFVGLDGKLLLSSRKVVLDSFGIDTMLAVPI